MTELELELRLAAAQVGAKDDYVLKTTGIVVWSHKQAAPPLPVRHRRVLPAARRPPARRPPEDGPDACLTSPTGGRGGPTPRGSPRRGPSRAGAVAGAGRPSRAPPAYVHPTAVVDAGAVLEPGVKVWHFVHVSKGARIGAGTSLGQNVFVAPGRRRRPRVQDPEQREPLRGRHARGRRLRRPERRVHERDQPARARVAPRTSSRPRWCAVTRRSARTRPSCAARPSREGAFVGRRRRRHEGRRAVRAREGRARAARRATRARAARCCAAPRRPSRRPAASRCPGCGARWRRAARPAGSRPPPEGARALIPGVRRDARGPPRGVRRLVPERRDLAAPPRGEPEQDRRSHCPRCGHAIRWSHNVPVLGWLMLRGRCADCRAPISPRYPIVEALGRAPVPRGARAPPAGRADGPVRDEGLRALGAARRRRSSTGTSGSSPTGSRSPASPSAASRPW